jgi:putative ABC transport system permease protein
MTWTRRRAEQELDDEMTAHLELAIRDLVARGLDPNEARLVAQREFGNVTGIREAARDLHRGARLERLALDVRHAWRRLRARPGTAAVAVAMLAVAIGLSSAMFTVVDAFLLRPAPFTHPETLVRLGLGKSDDDFNVNLPLSLVAAWRRDAPFAAVHAIVQKQVRVGVGDAAIPVSSWRVTPGLFEELGARPLLGRTLTAADAQPGAEATATIAEALWRDVLGADAGVIGRRVEMDGAPVTIVGVMPASFAFPFWRTRVWRPLDVDHAAASVRGYIYARLPVSTPRADVARLATAAAHALAPDTADTRLVMRPVADGLLDAYSAATVRVLGAGVTLVFLLLCVNVTNLMLARLGARRREFALCSVLGASRGRLLRQALCEQWLIGLAATLLGLALAAALVGIARVALPTSLLGGTLNPLDLDLRAVLATSGLSLLAVTIAGALPAILATRGPAAGSLRAVAPAATADRSARRLTTALIVVELALAVALSAAAGVQLRSFVHLLDEDRGLDADRLLTFAVAPTPGQRAPRGAPVPAAALRSALDGLAGVDGVTVSNGTPPVNGALYFYDVTADLAGARPRRLVMHAYHVAPDFFPVYGVRLVEGRAFQNGDPADAAMISQSMAATFWPGQSAVGRTMRFDDGRIFRIVGVTREVRNSLLDPRDDMPELYHPFAEASAVTVSVRCGRGCPAVDILAARLRSAAPGHSIGPAGRVRDAYSAALERPRAGTLVALTFAAVSLAAVGAGLFAVLTRAAQQRQREFGIRVALGASPADLRRLVHRGSVAIAVAGLAAGVALAWALGRLLTSVQYQVRSDDPLTWLVVSLVIGVTAAAAAWRPARQAMRADPVALLRAE